MNDTDLSDNAATQFLLTTEAGDESSSVEERALATVVAGKMWREAVRRCSTWLLRENDKLERQNRSLKEEIYRREKEFELRTKSLRDKLFELASLRPPPPIIITCDKERFEEIIREQSEIG